MLVCRCGCLAASDIEKLELILAKQYCKIMAMNKRKEVVYKYEAIFDPNGEGYTVTVPKLPGLVTEGSSIRDAREMAKDAIRCYLESMLKAKALHSPRASAVKRRVFVEVGA